MSDDPDKKMTASGDNARLIRVQRVAERLPPVENFRRARQELVEQFKYRDLSLLGHTIVFRAVEFLPDVFNPDAKTALEYIGRAIEHACDQLGLPYQVGTAPGVTPDIGRGAASDDFFGAASSILGTLVAFTNTLAHLLVETMEHTGEEGKEFILIDEEACLRRVLENKQLREGWERFFLRGAGVFFKGPESAAELSKRQEETKFQLTSAMEVFALGHEYGHHISRHKPGFRPELPFHHELNADLIAWRIGQFLGACGLAANIAPVRNTWMESGAGAVALLRAAQVVRSTRNILESGEHRWGERSPGHLPYAERLESLEKWDGFDQEPLAGDFRDQRWFVGRLIPRIFDALRLRLSAGHKAGLKPISVTALREHIIANEKPQRVLVGLLTEDLTYPDDDEIIPTETSQAIEAALAAMRAKSETNPAGMGDYLRYHQEKSVQRFTDSVLRNRVGYTAPELTASITEKLRIGRTAGPQLRFQEVVDAHSYSIERMCAKLGLPMHGGIRCGVAWDPAMGPIQRSLSAGESIILVPESTLMLCHFISKLLARALPIKAEGERLAITIDPKLALRKLVSSAKLRKYAAGGLAYCAVSNRRGLIRVSKLAGNQKTLWYHLLRSTELFVMAHEYAHHICGHGWPDSMSSEGLPTDLLKAQELQADWYGALIVAHIGAEERLPFAHDGTAAVIALAAMEILRRVKSILERGTEDELNSDTHPPLSLRVLNLGQLPYDEREADSVRAAQHNFQSIMDRVWKLIMPELQRMRARGFRPIAATGNDGPWLPG